MASQDRVREVRSTPRLPESLTRYVSDPEAGMPAVRDRTPRPAGIAVRVQYAAVAAITGAIFLLLLACVFG